MRRRITVLAAPLIIAFAVCGWLVYDRTRNKLDAAAAEYVECFNRRDAGCMMKYLNAAEEDRLGLDQASLQEFLDKYVAKELDGFSPIGPLVPDPKNHRLGSNYVQWYEHRDGRRIAFGVDFWQMGDELGTCIVWPLWNLVIQSKRPAGAPPLYSPSMRKGLVASLRKDLTRLNGLRLKGAVQMSIRSTREPTRDETIRSIFRPPSTRGMSHWVMGEPTWRKIVDDMSGRRPPGTRLAKDGVEVIPRGVEPTDIAKNYPHKRRFAGEKEAH